MRENTKGFTLVELMVTMLLSGIILLIALPFIRIGRNASAKAMKTEMDFLAGEAIYEFVADELTFADRIYLGDNADKRPDGGEWKSITTSQKGDLEGQNAHSRLLFGKTDETGHSRSPGELLYDETYQERTDLVIETEATGKSQLTLTVRLTEDEEVLYEKSASLSLLNLTLHEARQIEGYATGKRTTAPTRPEEGEPLVIWYQSTEDEMIKR